MDSSIFIFSLSHCKKCKEALKLFNHYDISYDFTNVDLLNTQQQQSIVKDLKRVGQIASFPAIIIGDMVVSGYNKKEIIHTLKVKKLIKNKILTKVLANLAILWGNFWALIPIVKEHGGEESCPIR